MTSFPPSRRFRSGVRALAATFALASTTAFGFFGCFVACTGELSSNNPLSPGTNGSGSNPGSGNPGGGSKTGGNSGTGSNTSTGGKTGTGSNTGTGNSNGSATGGSTSLPPPPTNLPTSTACTGNSPGPRKIRRLTAKQFDNTLRDIFKDSNVPKVTIFDDTQVLGFTVDADALVVQGLTAQQLADYAEQVADWAVTNKLSSLTSCMTMESNCRQTFIKSFGKRAFRDVPTADQVKAYESLMSAEANFSDGAEAVIAAMLQSPYMLYRREIGPVNAATSGTINLTPYEIASSLSYLLIGSMPDDQLLSAADNNQLSNKSQLDQQVSRLLQDSRSSDGVMEFFRGWLTLGKFDTTVKNDSVYKLTDNMRTAMKGETQNFLMDLFKNGGTVSDLFTANYTFLNSDLAQFYGINASGVSGSNFTKVTLDSSMKRDPGVLAHADILTGNADAEISSPVFRGKLVRTRLLCGNIPPPPSNLDTKLKPPASPTETTREHFSQHSTDPVCYTCHKQMDPIGFGFEHYDAFGRWRDQENGVNIDATGTVYGTSKGDVAFNGLKELQTFLASSDDVKNCAVRFWAYFAYGSASWDQDACTYSAVQAEAAANGSKLKDILSGLVHAPHFTQRLAQ